MKWCLGLVLLAALAGAALADDASGSGKQRAQLAGKALIGQPGPSAALTSIDGQRIDLAALYGKQAVYLKFWATWCKPCNEQAPGFEKLYQQYGKRIAVVSVNTGYSETEAVKRTAPDAPLLAKPFRADALDKAVRNALASDG